MTAGASSLGQRRLMLTSGTSLLVLAALVFALVLFCIEITAHVDRIATIWLSNAIILAYLMKTPRREWYKILTVGYLANAAANFATGDPGLNIAIIPALNICEVMMVALPLRLWRYDHDFVRPRSLVVFYALAGGPATILPALFATAYFGSISDANFLTTAINWYAADALGLAIVVPPLMTVRPSELKAMFNREQLAASLLFIGLVVAVAVLNFMARSFPVAFLFYPACILITFKRGFAGGAIGLLIAASYMIVPVVVGNVSAGLRGHTLHDQMTVVQIFVAVCGLSIVLMGAALDELKRLTHRLATAMRSAENAREEAIVARDAAVQASRAKSMFLANMSHELRTPLNAVIGFADIMHSEVFGKLGDARYHEYTAHIQGAGQHLLDLINDILDMSKIEAGKMELERTDFSIDGKVRECIELMQERANTAGVELAADLPPGTLLIHADARAVRQILLNLLSNAIKFTPAGGRVVSRARVIDGLLVLSVRDTGIGIPASRIQDLGNPFVQLRNSAGETQPGTGLGLALVRSLAELHHGNMKIESAEGRGTTVTVEFPAHDEGALAAA